MPDDRPAEQGMPTPRQVAELLGVTNRKLRRMAKQDGFPQPARFNRKLVRWKAGDMLRYIEALPPTNAPADRS